MSYLTGTCFNLWIKLGKFDVALRVAQKYMECRLGLWIKKGMTVAKGTYNGQINDNFDRHGIGRWISHNGWNIYEGEYKNDEQCGYGR